MIIFQNTLISDEILEKKFVCNLDKCKGACCVEGDSGAPLEDKEIAEIERNLEAIKPFMSKKGLALLAAEGFWETDSDKEKGTRCLPEGNCVFETKNEIGISQCSIELAHKAEKSTFLKPISCHLYPIRMKNYGEYQALNYHEWDICKHACDFGEELKVPVYEFLKSSLIRKFGEDWYGEFLQMIHDREHNR